MLHHLARAFSPPRPAARDTRTPARTPPVHRPTRGLFVLGLLGILTLSCAAPPPPAAPERVVGSLARVDAQIAADPALERLIDPYRREVAAQMSVPLAICPVEMRTGRPEGLLGALTADMVLERAREISGLAIDACVLNNGGLRIPWPPGTITLRLVYEVMPFDNTITILRLSRRQIETLIEELAQAFGEPVSGIRFEIRGEERRVDGVRVAGRPLAERDYWVATNSYLAQGGGRMPSLWEPLEARATNELVRDAIATMTRRHGAAPPAAAGEALGRLPVPEMGRILADEESR
jgi:2',3'-cyclic-nucleotide 2'-phosphodiesterase (5'-nucleotidase family)